ncbi:hypothetical protein QR98_0051320 [Sarcoptes scabiei]|uniref:Uncharacterized protein n=1 Tax=Sarcoptes scabiei TaxID=52283 RepID=A0A132A6T1_SARSC|nr:hypothetical protein QR98_0051320 [Sarcoptes scabiei]
MEKKKTNQNRQVVIHSSLTNHKSGNLNHKRELVCKIFENCHRKNHLKFNTERRLDNIGSNI